MKVLLIENQKIQFDDISRFLSNNQFEVVPTEDFFPCLMNLVKIILNMENSETRRNKAKEEFFSYIDVEYPEIFLIDYKISGSTFAGTGIELGKILNGKFPFVPNIFLSKYSENFEEIKNKLEGLSFQNWKWVEKGYAGQSIVDEIYMEKYLLKSIYELVNDNVFNEERKELERILIEAIAKFMRVIADFWPLKDENKITRQIAANFTHISKEKYNIETQVNRGFSASNIKIGTVDIEIFKPNGETAIITENVRLISVEKPKILNHIEKTLINYNTDGKPFVIFIIYYIGDKFQKFVTRYSDYIKDLDYSLLLLTLKLNETITRKNEESNNNQNIEIIEQKLSDGKNHKRIHHILANFNVSKK